LTITTSLSSSVTITSDYNSVCNGSPVTFTAHPTNGGSNPNYQWKLNGVNVGTNSNVYTNSNLSNNDAVTVQLTASNVADVVVIGSQVWSSKNLDVTTYSNGDVIPQVSNAAQWYNLTTGAWCWYNNDSATYASTYGKLYNWYAVNDSRGLAPNGWHVPANSDWATLI